MNHKDDLNKILYLLGEENALNSTGKPHSFSEKYEKEKLKMIDNENNIKTNSDEENPSTLITKHKKLSLKKSIAVVAAIVATLGITATVYGIANKYTFQVSKDEETGKLTYSIESASTITKIPEIKIIPEYLPEGYIESNAPGKYHPNGDLGSPGISICQAYDSDELSYPYVSSIEDATIGGVKAQILTRDGSEYNHIINLFYEEDGQIISLYASNEIPLDEVKKVAEHIRYEEIPGSFIYVEANSKAKHKNKNETPPGVKITDDYIFSIGEEKQDVTCFDNSPTYQVDNIEILDKLPELDIKNFRNHESYLENINEDGYPKPYERMNSETWKNNKMNKEIQTADVKFVSVTITFRNPFDKELTNKNIYPRLFLLNSAGDNTFTEKYYFSNNELQINGAPFYFDQSNYGGDHFYFTDFNKNESKTVHLIYAVDEDRIDNCYISFNFSGMESRDTTPNSNYIKLTK